MGAFSNEAFSTSAFSVDAFDIGTPANTPDTTFAVSAIIQERGKGVLSSINQNGQSVLSTIINSFAVSSTIQERGKGLTGIINPDGQGVNGKI